MLYNRYCRTKYCGFCKEVNQLTAIRFYREKLGITQKSLAEELGISQGAIANWENDIRKPDIFMLKRIAEVLHCTTDELLNVPEQNAKEGT